MMAKKLRVLRLSDLIADLNIAKTVSDLDDAFRDPSNPLRQGLPLTSKTIFIDILKFGLTHNKELIYTILCLTTGTRTEYDKSTVISTAKLFLEMGSKFNSTSNSTFSKLQGVVFAF